VLVTAGSTPIDEALPAIAVVLTAVAAFTHPAVQLAIPLLMAGEIGIADERTRLVWFGIVVAVSMAGAVLQLRIRPSAYIVTVSCIVLLRWIPYSEVMPGREIVLIAIALGVVMLLRATPLAIVIAVMAALFTPAVPLRTLGVPLAVLMAAAIARLFRLSPRHTDAAAAFLLAVPLLFFAWSGAFARTFPLMLRGVPSHAARQPVQMALRPGQSVEIDVPGGAGSLVLSAANMARVKEGVVLGRIEPGAVIVRMGDVADWAAFRREQYHAARNRVPRHSAGLLRGYGQTAWIDGAGRVQLSGRATRITVTADPSIPPAGRLQIDAFELEQR
jgi:hypothetical protein